MRSAVRVLVATFLLLSLTACPRDFWLFQTGGDSGNDGGGSKRYVIGGTLTGLDTGKTLILAITGLPNFTLTADGTYVFSNTAPAGTAYTVSVATQPAGQTCSVSNGSGTVVAADVTNINVNCVAAVYSIGGTLTGLAAGKTLELATAGLPNLTLSADGSYVFGNTAADGLAYAVSVVTQPAGQTCTVSNDSGTVAAADVTNINVNCVAAVYTLGGTLNGLAAGKTLELATAGLPNLTLSADGSYVFANTAADGMAYNVTVVTQPAGQTCSVSNGSGTVVAANVTNINVSCVAAVYTLGGTVTGLGGGTLELTTAGQTNLTLSADGGFAFANTVGTGTAYAISVVTQPTGQTCTVSNGSGTVLAADVTDINVDCVTATFTLGGTLNGLATGRTIELATAGLPNLTLSADGGFAFANTVADGTLYNVSIVTQPANQTCSVSNGSGIALTNVTDITVTCTAPVYTIGGTVTGLGGGTLELATAGQTNITLTQNGSYSFGTAVPDTTAYAVTVATQPTNQTYCTVTNGSGNVAGANISNIDVNCVFSGQCTNSADCADGNTCTTDVCVTGICLHTSNDGNACNDGNECTTDTCQSGQCVGADDPSRSPVINSMKRIKGASTFVITDYNDAVANQITNNNAGGGGVGPTKLDASDAYDPASCVTGNSTLRYWWIVSYTEPEINPFTDAGITGYLAPVLNIVPNALIQAPASGSPVRFELHMTSTVSGRETVVAPYAYVEQSTLTVTIFNQCQNVQAPCSIPAARPATEPTN